MSRVVTQKNETKLRKYIFISIYSKKKHTKEKKKPEINLFI